MVVQVYVFHSVREHSSDFAFINFCGRSILRTSYGQLRGGK